MIYKIENTIKELIAQGKIKSKWSLIESYGLNELINIIFEDEVDSTCVAQMTVFEDGVVSSILCDGIMHEENGEYSTLIKAYISTDNHIVLLNNKGSVFLYETEDLDGEDLRYSIPAE